MDKLVAGLHHHVCVLLHKLGQWRVVILFTLPDTDLDADSDSDWVYLQGVCIQGEGSLPQEGSASRGVCILGGGVGIGGRGSASRGSGVCPPPVLTFSGGHCNSRYVSYWNAFLSGVILCFTLCLCLRILQQDVWKYPVSTGMIHCWTVRSQKRCQPKAAVKVILILPSLPSKRSTIEYNNCSVLFWF